MSLVSSLNVGVSALRTYSEGIQVVSNNIANVNTVGYKASHAQYSDTFSNVLKPLVPNESNTAVKIAPTQIGGGVQVESVAAVFSQGTIQATSSNSDLAIAGNGFFRVLNPQTGQVFVTRAGNFRVDADGFMVTQQGFRVQGAVGAKTKVVYDSTTGSYDVKGQQDNQSVKIPSGITTKVVSGAHPVLAETIVSVDSGVSGLQVGMPISGSGIPTGATIVGIDPVKKTFTMSAAGTSTPSSAVSLVANLKTLDSGSISIVLPADYSRTDLVEGMVVSGAGIPAGTTVQSFTGNLKRVIPSSTSSVSFPGSSGNTASKTIAVAGGVDGLAVGMILSGAAGIKSGTKVVAVHPESSTFEVDMAPTVAFSSATIIAAGGKTLDSGSNVLSISDLSGISSGLSVSGEGLAKSTFVGRTSGVPNIDSTYSLSLVDHPPVSVTKFAGEPTVAMFIPATSVPGGVSTVAVEDTAGIHLGDSITKVVKTTGDATWTAGENTISIDGDVATKFSIGDVVLDLKGIPFGATITAVPTVSGTGSNMKTTLTLSARATTGNETKTVTSSEEVTTTSTTTNSISTLRNYGTVTSITSGTSLVMKVDANQMDTTPSVGDEYVAYGQPVYPPGNSYASVHLAFGDATVTLSDRPSVDSFGDVSLSLGTYYTPAAKVGDVKVSFDEGSNYEFYGTGGEKLVGIPLASARNSAPKIRTFNVGTAGDINVILSNGQTFTAGKVLLMSFRDPGALTREGDNLFSGLYTAGPYNGVWDNANIANFTPSFKGMGSINGGSLELSNVDIGEEFATMITTQRAFQAGSRVITTTDQMLEEAVNLKR